MRIPKKYRLYGIEVKVITDPCLIQREDNVGEYHSREGYILLQPNTNGYRVVRSQAEKVFCHELVHSILDAMSEEELSKNEKFVDNFGSLLHQALSTQKGKLCVDDT